MTEHPKSSRIYLSRQINSENLERLSRSNLLATTFTKTILGKKYFGPEILCARYFGPEIL